MKKRYYIDTCIWLNLFKKEVDSKSGIQYWKFAKDLIEEIEEKQDNMIISTIVLKELYFTINEKFQDIKEFFKESDFIQIIKTDPTDYDLARKWEKEDGKLSFYDYLHVAISKRLNLHLITRDEALIIFAKSHVNVSKPERLFS